MNPNFREMIRRLNIKSFLNRHCLWRCCRCCLNYFLLLGQRASVCIFDHLFLRLPIDCVWAFVLLRASFRMKKRDLLKTKPSDLKCL